MTFHNNQEECSGIKIKRFFLKLCIIIAVFVLFGLILFGLAAADVHGDMFTAAAEDGLPAEFAGAVISDNYYFLTEERLNSYAAFVLNTSNQSHDEDISVTKICFDFNETVPSHMYAKVKCGSRDYVVAADCSISVNDNHISAELANFTVGKLPIHKLAVKTILSNADLGAAAEYISVSDLAVKVPSHFGVNMGEGQELAAVDILDVSVLDDGLELSTNPVVKDALTNAADILIDKLGDVFNY